MPSNGVLEETTKKQTQEYGGTTKLGESIQVSENTSACCPLEDLSSEISHPDMGKEEDLSSTTKASISATTHVNELSYPHIEEITGTTTTEKICSSMETSANTHAQNAKDYASARTPLPDSSSAKEVVQSTRITEELVGSCGNKVQLNTGEDKLLQESKVMLEEGSFTNTTHASAQFPQSSANQNNNNKVSSKRLNRNM